MSENTFLCLILIFSLFIIGFAIVLIYFPAVGKVTGAGASTALYIIGSLIGALGVVGVGASIDGFE